MKARTSSISLMVPDRDVDAHLSGRFSWHLRGRIGDSERERAGGPRITLE
jgi:hypothetical protein